MMPLYGFLEGDTLGLLILAREDETVAQLAERLAASAAVRVARRPRLEVVHRGRVLDPAAKLAEAGVEPLDRFDVWGG
jgi:hypothetical protein